MNTERMIPDWEHIQTVLLDMDGTLLDLHFDNYFWQQHLPACWAGQRGLSPSQARDRLAPHFRAIEGTLAWYCVDYWSRELELDLLALKDDVQHLIGLRPHAELFLQALAQLGKRCILVTNAHPDVLDYKLHRTGIGVHFEAMFSAHALGEAKESPAFWQSLQQRRPFDPARTLLIDDNLQVLETAATFGIRHLLTIAQPDSRQPVRSIEGFAAVEDFRQLLPVAASACQAKGKVAD